MLEHPLNMKQIIGTKGPMSQIFDDSGKVFPVTVVTIPTNVVVGIRTTKKDGYEAVQIGTGSRKEKNINKAQKGQFGEYGSFAHVQEFRLTDPAALALGDTLTTEAFTEGEKVHVTGITKGKGFQGVVKRWNFAGGRRSHGEKHTERAPGSIGATGPQRVLKGLKMGGRMGGDRVTVKNLVVVKVDNEAGVLYIKGALPGRPGTLLEIKAKAA